MKKKKPTHLRRWGGTRGGPWECGEEGSKPGQWDITQPREKRLPPKKKKKKGYHLATVAGWVKCWQELSRMKTIKYLQCLEIKRTLVIPVGKISVEQHSQDWMLWTEERKGGKELETLASMIFLRNLTLKGAECLSSSRTESWLVDWLVACLLN